MPSYRFVHAADLHLDSPFKGLKRVSPGIAEVLRKSTFDAFGAVIKLCIDEQVDALLVAGDVFDSADRSGSSFQGILLESAKRPVDHGSHGI